MIDIVCPLAGKYLQFTSRSRKVGAVMGPRTPTPETELVRRVAESAGLSRHEARRVLGDVVAYFAEPVEVVVRRRHTELKRAGLKNPEIFAQITTELTGRVVAAPPLSERQLRRIVYG